MSLRRNPYVPALAFPTGSYALYCDVYHVSEADVPTASDTCHFACSPKTTRHGTASGGIRRPLVETCPPPPEGSKSRNPLDLNMNLLSIHFSLHPPLSRPFCNICNANAEDEVQPNAKALLESYSNLDILRYGQGPMTKINS